MFGHRYCKSMDQPGKVANPARGQLNRENEYSLIRIRACIWSRKTVSAVPSRVSLFISILRLNLVLNFFIPNVRISGSVNTESIWSLQTCVMWTSVRFSRVFLYLLFAAYNSQLCELRIDYLIEEDG